MVGAEIHDIQVVFLDELPESQVLRRSDLFQPIFHDQAVLILELHHIAHRGDSRKLQEVHPLAFRNFKILVEHLDELPGHHSATDLMERVGLPVLLRVNDRIRRRQDLSVLIHRDLVVICHNNCHAQLFRDADFPQRRDSVITSHKCVHAVRSRLADNGFIDAVAVLDAVRDLVVDHRIHPTFSQSCTVFFCISGPGIALSRNCRVILRQLLRCSLKSL